MAIVQALLSEQSPDQRKALLAENHPVYRSHVTQWTVGLDAYDGAGGFLNGDYLWRFPREDEDQFARRRKQARYHNYTETLVDIYVRAIVNGIVRTSDDQSLMEWWDNVDGRGTSMDTYMEALLGQSLASGHAGVLMDKADELPRGPAVSDDPNRPYLTTFPSTSIRDWRMDRFGLTAVKLSEDVRVPDFQTSVDLQKPGTLVWDREMWARFDANGELLGAAPHDVGRIPFLMLRPKPSRRHSLIGKPLVAPSVTQALYNRASEEDLVLRDQAFSLFVVELPIDATQDDIEQIQTRLSSGVGTTTVMVIKGNAEFRTADMQVPKTIRDGQAALIHEMYRAAHLRFERDSLDAESAEAVRLQRQDLTSALSKIAETMAELEDRLTWLFFAWMTPNADQAKERANVSIQYPDSFDLINLEQELTALGLALSMDLGQTASQEIKKRAVHVTLPDLSDETLELVTQEIETVDEQAEPSLGDQARQRLEAGGIAVEAV